jgi:tetratricopeptide (TPR) repeat protein
MSSVAGAPALSVRALALGDTSTSAGPCSVAAGRDASNNTLTCNFGLTPEQLREVTEGAVAGATSSMTKEIVNISKRLGVTEDAAKTLLRIAGEQTNVPDERLAETLTKIANDYKRLQEQVAALSPDNLIAKKLVEQARPEIEVGHFERARDLLRGAAQAQLAAADQARKLADQASAAADAQMLGAASTTAAEGDVALTERHYDQAAELFAQAAAHVPATKPNERIGYFRKEANSFYRLGDERGENTALVRAIELYRGLLSETPRERAPLDWATTQNNLGNALEALGERESGTARLEQAVAAYRAALEEWTRERVPVKWAMAQSNLGFSLFRLGERESGTERLEEAVVAYRAALEEQTRERVPLNWAATQNNLGNALRALGERESGTARLEEAVEVCRKALEGLARERVPLGWANAQDSLGDALLSLGNRESGTERLEEAVAAYRSALEERTRERVPREWAETQGKLTHALNVLSERRELNARDRLGTR